MSYKIVPTDNFSRELKRLSKKHPLLKQKIKDFSSELLTNPKIGTPIGHNCYKIRVSTPDKSRGKSKGFRIISYVFFKKRDSILIIYLRQIRSLNFEGLGNKTNN